MRYQRKKRTRNASITDFVLHVGEELGLAQELGLAALADGLGLVPHELDDLGRRADAVGAEALVAVVALGHADREEAQR
jgi:hypothetical protein